MISIRKKKQKKGKKSESVRSIACEERMGNRGQSIRGHLFTFQVLIQGTEKKTREYMNSLKLFFASKRKRLCYGSFLQDHLFTTIRYFFFPHRGTHNGP